MSRMLIFPFADSAIASARVLFQLGRTSEALSRLQAVLHQERLSADTAFAVHQLAGEIALDSERFARARKHFRQALRIRPGHAESYFLLGLAEQKDPLGCDRRAAIYFRQAFRLTPDRAEYQAAFGLAVLRCRSVPQGLKHLRRAFQKSPEKIFVLETLVDGFIEAQRPERCRALLTQARFAGVAPVVIDRLESRLRFEMARKQQEWQLRRSRNYGEPRLLPFLRVESESGSSTRTGNFTGGIVRRDVASWPSPHFGRSPTHRAEPG